MAVHAKRVIAGLLALLGLLLTGGGLWLATQIGPSGATTFTMTPSRPGAVLVTPAVLNRLDGDIVVTATAAKGDAPVWMGRATPSDADLIVGSTPATRLTGFSVRDGWVLRSAPSGEGDVPDFAKADLWREFVSGAGKQTLVVSPDEAPETVVISADGGQVGPVSVTVERKAWFVQSLLAAVVGLALLATGILLWRSRLGSRPDSTVPRRASATKESVQPTAVPTPEPSEQAPQASARRLDEHQGPPPAAETPGGEPSAQEKNWVPGPPTETTEDPR